MGQINTKHPMDIALETVQPGFTRCDHQRLVTSITTKMALQKKKSEGLRVGDIPYGFSLGEDGKRLVPNEYEEAIIDEIDYLIRAGLSFRAVSDELARNGYFNRAGNKFSPEMIWRLYHGK